MPKTISKDAPLAEITLRKYEKPIDLDRRELVKKICLSIGLLQPGDSRDVIVDVFHTILESGEPLDSKQVEVVVIKSRNERKLPVKGVASSNIRRQLRRLKEMFLIESVQNKYRVRENESLDKIFDVLKAARELEFTIHILTKGPILATPSWTEKVEWVMRHVPDAGVTVTQEKRLGYGKFLVDDYPGYISEWLAH